MATERIMNHELRIKNQISLVLFIFLLPLLPIFSVKAEVVDSDGDDLSDDQETNIYLTDPQNADTDRDGFNDKTELINGYSPLLAGKRITEVDTDKDGLNDGLELAFGTKINNPDSDGDGFKDGEEVNNSYNPASLNNQKLEKKIEVDISEQRLDYFLGRAKLGSFQISTGKLSTPTPLGVFTIANKDVRRKSKVGDLIMPYWMAFKDDLYAIHDLPEWPGGQKEGADHLGKKVSHGCVRLATVNAQFLYNWTPVGTKVVISN
jgi:hypothetical protein